MNPFEQANRERKASALLIAILREDLTLDDVVRIDLAGWLALSRKAGTPPPSYLTMRIVVEQLEHRERGAA